MSAARLRGPAWPILAVFSLALGLACTAPGWAGDLEKFRREQEVAAQKLIADLNKILAESRRLEATDAAGARDLLLRGKALLAGADDRILTDQQKQSYQRQLQNRLREVEATVRERENAARFGSGAKGDQVAQGPGGKPGNPPDFVKKANDFISKGKDAIGKNQGLKQKKEDGFVKTTQEVHVTASQMTEQRITERFIRASERELRKYTKAELELLKMLNSTLSVDWNKATFKEVLEYLMEKTGQNIFVDDMSLKEAMVEYDDPVTFKAKKVTVRTILKKVLADKGLTFVIKDAAVHVMTPARASEHMVARAYPIGDLMPLVDPRWGPFVQKAQTYKAVNDLMLLIVNTVEPASWQVNGGRGTIVFNEASMALIIRNTAEMHYQLAGALR